MKFNIIYEDNHLLVIEKPVNIAVMEDQSKDTDLLNLLKQDLKIRYNKPGNVYLGLVHRLDRPVGGVMVFAKTSKAASRLSAQIQAHQMKKHYTAILTNRLANDEGKLEDYLLKNKATNTVRVVDKNTKGGKYSALTYTQGPTVNGLTKVEIDLITGRSHQIRVQFASRNCALWGDQRYNKSALVGQQIALFASRLTFKHPVTNQELTFTCPLPNKFPYNLF